MDSFRQTIIQLLEQFIQDNKDYEWHQDDVQLARKFIKHLPTDLILPIATSTNQDPIEVLIDNFKWNLEYGSLKYCCFDDSYAWFPFIISYSWCKQVKLFLVNLTSQKLALKEVISETDYTSHSEMNIRFLINRYKDGILPMKDYAYTYEDASMFEAVFDRIEVKDEDTTLKLFLDKDEYCLDKQTKQVYFNQKLIDPEDEDDDTIHLFIKILKGEDYCCDGLFKKYLETG